MEVFSIVFMFILILVTICSYSGYYYQYGKLARYFLSNMYRFKSSYVLMTIVFGIKPFLKGFVHAMFFENWFLQIWLLIGIESLVIVVIILFEIICDNHKSRLKLFFELLYSFCYVGLNVILLCRYEYLVDNEAFQQEIELYTKLLVYLMLIVLLLRVVMEIKEAIECKCCSNTIVPEEQLKNSQKSKNSIDENI